MASGRVKADGLVSALPGRLCGGRSAGRYRWFVETEKMARSYMPVGLFSDSSPVTWGGPGPLPGFWRCWSNPVLAFGTPWKRQLCSRLSSAGDIAASFQ